MRIVVARVIESMLVIKGEMVEEFRDPPEAGDASITATMHPQTANTLVTGICEERVSHTCFCETKKNRWHDHVPRPIPYQVAAIDLKFNVILP